MAAALMVSAQNGQFFSRLVGGELPISGLSIEFFSSAASLRSLPIRSSTGARTKDHCCGWSSLLRNVMLPLAQQAWGCRTRPAGRAFLYQHHRVRRHMYGLSTSTSTSTSGRDSLEPGCPDGFPKGTQTALAGCKTTDVDMPLGSF